MQIRLINLKSTPHCHGKMRKRKNKIYKNSYNTQNSQPKWPNDCLTTYMGDVVCKNKVVDM